MGTDPVCKMDVSEKNCKYTSIFQSKSQWFCSAECKSQFDQNPEKYKTDSGGSATDREMRDRLVSQGKDLMGKAKTRSASFLTDKTKKAADTLDDVAKAFRESVNKFEERQQTGISHYVKQAAERIESLSRYFRESDPDRLVEDAENFIQKKPALILGSVLAAGFLTARFLKSSRAETSRRA